MAPTIPYSNFEILTPPPTSPAHPTLLPSLSAFGLSTTRFVQVVYEIDVTLRHTVRKDLDAKVSRYFLRGHVMVKGLQGDKNKS